VLDAWSSTHLEAHKYQEVIYLSLSLHRLQVSLVMSLVI
jgi:hypothetical protein